MLNLRFCSIVLLFALALVIAGCSSTRTSTTNAANPDAQPGQTDQAEAVDLLRESGVDLTQLVSIPEDAIPEYVIARANCIVVIPQMVKGGFVFGAKHGSGVATCKHGNQWSAPAFVTLTGGSWGAQIGVQVADVVLAVMNKEGMDALLESNFQLGAHGSVAAGPVGRAAAAEQGGMAQAGVLTYSRTKGLYAGLTLEGAYIREHKDLNQAYYGRPIQARTVLSGEIDAPQNASLFLNSVRSASAESQGRRAREAATE
ncbi:MAG: lipid-binding SYLF domain-containing protein [Candidatus Korobacteraceae bacterium]